VTADLSCNGSTLGAAAPPTVPTGPRVSEGCIGQLAGPGPRVTPLGCGDGSCCPVGVSPAGVGDDCRTHRAGGAPSRCVPAATGSNSAGRQPADSATRGIAFVENMVHDSTAGSIPLGTGRLRAWTGETETPLRVTQCLSSGDECGVDSGWRSDISDPAVWSDDTEQKRSLLAQRTRARRTVASALAALSTLSEHGAIAVGRSVGARARRHPPCCGSLG